MPSGIAGNYAIQLNTTKNKGDAEADNSNLVFTNSAAANTSMTAKAKIVVAWRDNGGYDVDQKVPPRRAEIHMEDVGICTE